MKKIIALLLVITALFSLAACSKAEKRIYFDALDDNVKFSGVVFVTENGDTVYEKAGGYEKSSTKDPITTDTLFCIGSVSKQIAAAAILTLKQDDKLSVDDHLSKYYPKYAYGDDITIRHLLDMRSGIKEFYDVEYIDDAFTELPTGKLRGVLTNDNTVEENRQKLEDWILKQPLEFSPDTDFDYCNSNYFLLARIVEKVSGMSYIDYVHKNIFEPLGMKHSSFIDEVEFKNVPHLAAPTVHPQTVYVGITMGLGDMISNARDMDLWLTSLRTHTILSEDSVDMMGTDYTPGDDVDYGFGVRVIGNGMFHSGSITTYQAMVYTDPDKELNIFAVTNDEPNACLSVSDIIWKLLDQIKVQETKQ